MAYLCSSVKNGTLSNRDKNMAAQSSCDTTPVRGASCLAWLASNQAAQTLPRRARCRCGGRKYVTTTAQREAAKKMDGVLGQQLV